MPCTSHLCGLWCLSDKVWSLRRAEVKIKHFHGCSWRSAGCVCAGTWAHVCAGYKNRASFYQPSLIWLLSEPRVWEHFGMCLLEMKIYHTECKIQPQDSERGFWAWGRVTINLVKSTDESLSHSYNQKIFRPLFPQRNSCLLRRVLKFYLKNSQHLKAACSALPGFHLQRVFPSFLNHITGFLDVVWVAYLHQIRTQEDLARHACACRRRLSETSYSSHSKRRVQSQHHCVWEIILLSSPLSSQGNRGPEKRWEQFYAVHHCFSKLRNQIHPVLKCFLIVF